jgi:hypothetical protein
MGGAHTIRYKNSIVKARHVVCLIVMEKKFSVPADSLFFKGKSVWDRVFAQVVGEQASSGSPW